ncbi:hypothetical protein Hte_000275 [Hypoxylon texense]
MSHPFGWTGNNQGAQASQSSAPFVMGYNLQNSPQYPVERATTVGLPGAGNPFAFRTWNGPPYGPFAAGYTVPGSAPGYVHGSAPHNVAPSRAVPGYVAPTTSLPFPNYNQPNNRQPDNTQPENSQLSTSQSTEVKLDSSGRVPSLNTSSPPPSPSPSGR